jgi:hypothetical protein
MGGASLLVTLAASVAFARSPAPPRPSPLVAPSVAASPSAGEPVILFLIDNSASLPPLDPEEKRVAALEKMFSFLQGKPYRLILFGGRNEVFVDDVSRYRNTGQWTDYYWAFQKARDIAKEYPPGTEFRMVLFTDAIIDPSPDDWAGVERPVGVDLRRFAGDRVVDLLKEMKLPLYVILVGDAPSERTTELPERAPGLVRDMIQAANGARATAFAQSVAAFFADDGVLLKKFVFRVQPHEGLAGIKPVVTRIAAPASASVETGLFAGLVLPALLFIGLLLGILVRSFPGPGDVEIIELPMGAPVHVSVDRLHKLDGSSWAATGLSLVADPREATATFTYQPPALDLTGAGTDLTEIDAETRALLPLSLDELKKALAERAEHGTKDEKIFALNLDYMAKNLGAAEVERAILTPIAERGRIPAIAFLRAKAHLLSNDALRQSLLEPRVTVHTYGKGGERREARPGTSLRIGPYTFVVQDVAKGGRKDARLILHYDKIPSALGLKNWLPRRLQRIARFRRDSHRVVS